MIYFTTVTLTNGALIEFDRDMRPILNLNGIVAINNNGSWKALCANWTGIESSAATDVCISLGFAEYEKFQKLTIYAKDFNKKRNDDDGINSDLEHVKKIVLDQDKCDALYVKCSNTTNVDLTYQIGLENKFNATKYNLYNFPWNAAIYINGNYECIGIILNLNWILSFGNCFNKSK